jgi:Ca2+-transporting ATPase
MPRKWAPETISHELKEEHRAETEELQPPLRVISTLRGERARKNIRRGLRERMHDAKVKAKDKLKDHNFGAPTDSEKK